MQVCSSSSVPLRRGVVNKPSAKFWQTQKISPKVCCELCRYVEDMFRPGMEATVAEVAASGRHVAWAAACYRHGILMSREWSEVRA